jgi:hypothetical protein
LPFAIWHVGLQYYYLLHREVAPYIDVDFIRRTIALKGIHQPVVVYEVDELLDSPRTSLGDSVHTTLRRTGTS